MNSATFVFSAPLLHREPGAPFDHKAFEGATKAAKEEFSSLDDITLIHLHLRGIEVTYPPTLGAEDVVKRIEETANNVREADNQLFSSASRTITVRPSN